MHGVYRFDLCFYGHRRVARDGLLDPVAQPVVRAAGQRFQASLRHLLAHGVERQRVGVERQRDGSARRQRDGSDRVTFHPAALLGHSFSSPEVYPIFQYIPCNDLKFALYTVFQSFSS